MGDERKVEHCDYLCCSSFTACSRNGDYGKCEIYIVHQMSEADLAICRVIETIREEKLSVRTK